MNLAGDVENAEKLIADGLWLLHPHQSRMEEIRQLMKSDMSFDLSRKDLQMIGCSLGVCVLLLGIANRDTRAAAESN